MKSSIIAATLLSAVALAQTTGQLGDAAVVYNNPPGVSYQAVLPDKNTTTIRGQITGTSNANGTGVIWNMNFYGFPDPSLGPFLYHLHDQPVPANGNCSRTLAHLDPYIRGEKPPCDRAHPQTCQVGDLGGKYGDIVPGPGNSYQISYLDLYTSTQAGPASFFGNRSIVIHTFNTTRLTCANFTLVSTYGYGNTSTPSLTTVVPSPPSATSPPIQSFTGGATLQRMVSGGAVVAGLFAFAL